MRAWLNCSILGVLATLAACSSTPLQLPTCAIPEAPTFAQQPISLPELPLEVSSTDTTATFDLEGMLQLKRYRIASDTNTEIAQANALALEARNEEVNALIECSRYSKIWMEVREDQLNQERRDHFIDNLWHRGVIALGVIAAVL